MNGDGASNSDLLYIPRDQSEMNFSTFTVGSRTYTAAEQAAAFEAYIQQDSYMRERRGQYAERGAVFLPMFSRVDLSVMQDLFADVGGRRHGGQIRLDIFNFGNLINSDWGVSDRLVRNQLLTNPAVDAQGRATYRLAVVNSELLTRSYEKVASTSDVWSLMVSFRYTFQ
jgi:hypothetical protein